MIQTVLDRLNETPVQNISVKTVQNNSKIHREKDEYYFGSAKYLAYQMVRVKIRTFF